MYFTKKGRKPKLRRVVHPVLPHTVYLLLLLNPVYMTVPKLFLRIHPDSIIIDNVNLQLFSQ